jgi:hypothetical protein
MNALITRYVTNPKSHGTTFNNRQADALCQPINAFEIATPIRSSKIMMWRSRSENFMQTHL